MTFLSWPRLAGRFVSTYLKAIAALGRVRGEGERLAEVGFLKVREIGEQLLRGAASGKRPHGHAGCYTHAPDAGLAAHHPRVDRDGQESPHLTILTRSISDVEAVVQVEHGKRNSESHPAAAFECFPRPDGRGLQVAFLRILIRFGGLFPPHAVWKNRVMKRPFAASVWREGGWYVAQCPEIDVASQGETEEEALSNLKEALGLHFELPRGQAPVGSRRLHSGYPQRESREIRSPQRIRRGHCNHAQEARDPRWNPPQHPESGTFRSG